jgi:hypothetical protein
VGPRRVSVQTPRRRQRRVAVIRAAEPLQPLRPILRAGRCDHVGRTDAAAAYGVIRGHCRVGVTRTAVLDRRNQFDDAVARSPSGGGVVQRAVNTGDVVDRIRAIFPELRAVDVHVALRPRRAPQPGRPADSSVASGRNAGSGADGGPG